MATQFFIKYAMIIVIGMHALWNAAPTFASTTNQELYDKVSPSIYQLYAIDKDKQSIISLGNSVAISPQYLATNCHVALSGNFLIAKVNNQPYLARLCYFNQKDDLCIVDVVGIKLHPVQIRKSTSVKLGEKAYVIADLQSKQPQITEGVITKIIPQARYVVLQTNAHMEQGFSGGGLFDSSGQLIGITSGGISGTDVGYAIATELITEVMDPKSHPACRTPQAYDSTKQTLNDGLSR